MIFGDWDDVLITQDFRPLPPILDRIFQERPNAAAMLNEVHNAYVLKLGRYWLHTYLIFPKIRPWADFFQLSFLKNIV
jgi:hypothetical protein